MLASSEGSLILVKLWCLLVSKGVRVEPVRPTIGADKTLQGKPFLPSIGRLWNDSISFRTPKEGQNQQRKWKKCVCSVQRNIWYFRLSTCMPERSPVVDWFQNKEQNISPCPLTKSSPSCLWIEHDTPARGQGHWWQGLYFYTSGYCHT